MNRFPCQRDDAGSILVTMLVLLVVTSLSLLLVAQQVLSKTRNLESRAFTRALFVADAGLQRASYQLTTSTVGLPGVNGTSSAPVTETLPGGNGQTDTYTWNVRRVTPLEYVITSRGTAEGRSRTVTMKYVQQSLFSFAVFADKAIHFQGNGFIGSYKSGSGSPVIDPGNGSGFIGTNGALTSNGGVTSGGVGLYNNAGGASCSGPVCEKNLPGFPKAAPFNVASQDAAVAAQLATCKPSPSTVLPDYVASEDGQPGFPRLKAGVNCFRSLTMDAPVTPFPGTASLPVKVYIDGGKIEITTSDVGLGEFGSAPAFQIYAVNPSTSVVIEKEGRFVGALWAPRSDCKERDSNIEGINVFGSVICKTFGKDAGTKGNGNLRSYYDNSLSGIGDGVFTVNTFAEN